MKLFEKKYYPKLIAVGTSLLLYGLLFLFLNNSLNWESFSQNAEDILGEQIEINLEDILSEPPTKGNFSKSDLKENFKNNTRSQSVANEAAQPVQSETTQTVENVLQKKIDTVMLAQLEKITEELQKETPKDTIAEENKLAESFQRNLEDKYQTYRNEQKFRSDHYRAIYNFKKIYPYVLKTKQLVADLNVQLSTIDNKQERKRLIKETEKKLFEQYETAIRKMSRSQGNLLLKLISREISQTGYDLVKEYKGGISANFWYGVGLLFRQNLKSEYDSLKTDTIIEKIIIKYNKGKL